MPNFKTGQIPRELGRLSLLVSLGLDSQTGPRGDHAYETTFDNFDGTTAPSWEFYYSAAEEDQPINPTEQQILILDTRSQLQGTAARRA